MAQTRVIIPESPNPAFNHPHILPPWQHYREGIRTSHSRTSASSTHSHTRSIPICPSPRRTRTTGGTTDHQPRPHHHPSQPPSLPPLPPLPSDGPHHHHHHHHRQHTRSQSHYKEGRKPWEPMAQTYAWVLEQEIAEMSRKNEESVRWILEQQEREARERTVFAMLGLENRYREMMEQFVDDFEDLAEHLKAQEEHRRQNAMLWQREREKTAYEEMRRREHAAWREEVESYRMAYDRRKAQEAEKVRMWREQEKQRVKAARDEVEKEAWREYEENWAVLIPSSAAAAAEASAASLSFKSIPWPLFSPPGKPEDITPARLAMFFLSPNHSDGQTRKEKIKHALRRWHPDRFGRILTRVAEEDKKDVEEGAGIVVRCLNNLMERESKMITQNAQTH